MKNPGDEFNQKWREANERVRAAEDRMHAAWAQFAASGEPPSPALMAEVARLRKECDAELSQLLANIQVSRAGDGSTK